MSQLGLGSAIAAAQKSASVLAGNMSAALSNGEKGFNFIVSTNITGYGSGTSQFGGSTTKFVQKISTQGDIEATQTQTHMAIQGGGFFCIGDNLYTRLGDFEVDGQGFLTNSSGYTLKAWKLDDYGRKPGEVGNSDIRSAADLNALDKVNINGILSKPKATSSISIDARLNSGASVIKGAGQTFAFSSTDPYNAGNGNDDLIIPSGSRISIGDYFTVQIGASTTTYSYGGIGSTFDIGQVPAFSASSSSSVFQSLSAGSTYTAGGAAVSNDQIRIVVGSGAPIDLIFTPSAPRPEVGEFNSLSSLKDAINSSSLLKARLVNNTLFIAPRDGASSISFSNIGSGGTDFKSVLGFTDIQAYTGAGSQFTTINQLKSLLQEQPNILAVSTSQGAGVDISSKDPLQGIKFTSSAERENAIDYIYATQTDTSITTGALSSTSLRIKAPLSGLIIGDYVRISGLTGTAVFNGVASAIPDGIYPVLSVDSGGFTIPVHQAVSTGGVGVQVSEALGAGATWQKTPAASVSSISFVAGDLIERAAIANAATTATVTITRNAHGFANGDAININGIGLQNNIAVPNGIYSVANVTANTFEITVPQIANVGATAPVAAGALISGYAVKVGTTTTDHTVESTPVVSATGAFVTVQMPNNSFNEGDYISIAGNALYSPTDGNRYRVVSSTLTSFTFDVGSSADATGLVGSLTAGALPAGNYIDHFDKLDDDIGFDQASDDVLLESVYNPSDGSGANLVTGTFDGQWDQPLTIYDSLGNPYAFNMSFAKISHLRWAVQIHSVKNPITGQYPVDAGADGIVASGSITFNGSGTIDTIDSIGTFALNWINGSDPTTVTLNLGDTSSGGSSGIFSKGGVKHVHGSNQLLSISQDGYQPGKFSYLSVDAETGTINANYDNGASQSIYTIPLCYVTSPNTMRAVGRGVFTTTYESGNALLKSIGDDGVGQVITLALEKSNIENTEEMINLVSITAYAAYLSAAQQQLTQMTRDFSNRI
ncbi:MAG: flagellar hook-basal body complex protein [Alphaproteobacteria bacterium]|nr:flagellar hook-basal body complex protein [Alphaproteobacteria bacterium]